MEAQWTRKRRGRSQRAPLSIIHLYPFPDKDDENDPYIKHLPRPRLQEEYVVLELREHNNVHVCVAVPRPLLSGRGKKLPKVRSTYQLRPSNPSINLDTSTLDFHGTTKAVQLTKGVPKQNQDHNKKSYTPSILGNFDEQSEASIQKYATTALDKLNSLKNRNSTLYPGTFGLVECGPIALGHSPAGLILHFNLKARNNDATGASVETFFAELIETNRKVVSYVFVSCLGPSNLLPDKAQNYGCMYCSSHNIHHPSDDLMPGFHNGREDHWTTLKSQTQKLRDFRRKSADEGFIPLFSYPGLMYFGRNYVEAPSALATVALSLFNTRRNGINFKLAKLGSFGQRFTSSGLLVHLNFEAKNKDNPDAPLQTFFAEVLRCHVYIFAAFCECLGPSALVLSEEPTKYGCTFCVEYSVHHPPGPGYLNGREYFVVSQS